MELGLHASGTMSSILDPLSVLNQPVGRFPSGRNGRVLMLMIN
jgi:hypothetical protein